MKTEHIYVMRPEVSSSSSSNNNYSNASKRPSTASMDYAQRRQSLTEEFGSRKKKRALVAERSNTILAENISGAKSIGIMLSSNNPPQNISSDTAVSSKHTSGTSAGIHGTGTGSAPQSSSKKKRKQRSE
eukprot:CAMPEP_0175007980 /NCGR_PEP_ID=MMETSP0005-20121125/6725_1 /TAXON_ID=420556 /ORGANISM="Ochromonas sp., Strain CCMP1393" /LENGTH=129 /DNA_ID=CAMNT_0016263507 /DNA_START=313 /DNA_END=702 /DNA_ORIENTATION=-